MATVNKDFRVKNGLVVEGTTATVNGNDILTTASNTGNLPEGTNLYFTDARVVDAIQDEFISPASVTIRQFGGDIGSLAGLEGTLTLSSSQGGSDILLQPAQGQNVRIGNFGSAEIVATQPYVDSAIVTGINGIDTDDIEEGSTNLYFTDARAVAAVENGTFSSITVDQLLTGNGLLSIDNVITISSAQGSASITIAGETVATQTYVNTAVSNLVDTAPATLDTLNELAAALGDDPNFATTVTAAIGEKVAKAGDTMTGYLTLHADPENNLHAATKQYVDSAIVSGINGINTDVIEEGNTNLYYTDSRVADLLRNASLTNIQITGGGFGETLSIVAENGVADSTTDDLAEGSSNLYFTDQRAVSAVQSTDLSGLTYNDGGIGSTQAKTLGFHYPMSSGTTKNVFQFSASEYSSAKIFIQARETQGSYEVSEFLVLHNGTDVYITEYANVSSNSSIFDLTASLDGGNIQVTVTSAGSLGDFGVNGYATLLSLPAFS